MKYPFKIEHSPFLILTILFTILSYLLINPCKSVFPDILPKDWQKQSTRHFTLFYLRDDHRLADYIMERAEEDYQRIVKDIGIDPELKANVYLAPDRGSYEALQPSKEKTHEWSIGVFYPQENLIILLSPKAEKASHPDIQQIVAHELTHFILFNVTKDRGVDLPLWLHEGLAMYEARQWNWHYRITMAQTALTRSFLPLSSIKADFPVEKRLADRAYAQSISLIAYILNRYGIDYLNRMIGELVAGQPPAKVFYHVFGISLTEFERNWHIYLRRRYNWVPFLTSGFTIWFLISILAIGIYTYKRRQSQKRMDLWDIEEQMDSLFK
ncbi:MAG: peptidase MA family metallohydrolase [bacterium]